MEMLTRDQERLVRRLVEVAGSPLVLQVALRELSQEPAGQDHAIEQLVARIIKVRDRDREAVPA